MHKFADNLLRKLGKLICGEVSLNTARRIDCSMTEADFQSLWIANLCCIRFGAFIFLYLKI